MTSAWDQFWAAEQRDGGGCLAKRPAEVEAAQRRFWHEFASSLPRGAQVLDLATGNGVVMGWMIGARRDLKLIGVDLAEKLPPPPKGCRSRGGVAMEALPFADESRDAAASQFGIEYGDLRKVLGEISRVLKPGGRAAFLTHRSDGVIVEHNRSRRDGLRWALDEAMLVAKARGSLKLRPMGLAIPPALAAAPGEAIARFGAGSAAWEFAAAIAQSLLLGSRDSETAVLEVLATLEDKARQEIARIDSLERACRAVEDDAALRELFASSGLTLTSHGSLSERGAARAFADFWLLRKSGTARR